MELTFTKPLIPLSPDDFLFIVIHHAAASKCTIEDIHKWHLERGFIGVGYNEFINKQGKVFIGRGDNVGAHTQGYNSKGYGICLEGNFDEEIPSIEQIDMLISRLKYHSKRFKNLKSITDHKNLFQTSCPGKNLDISEIVSKVYSTSNNITIDEAIDILFNAKIINSIEFHKKTSEVVTFQKELIINMANFVKSKI